MRWTTFGMRSFSPLEHYVTRLYRSLKQATLLSDIIVRRTFVSICRACMSISAPYKFDRELTVSGLTFPESDNDSSKKDSRFRNTLKNIIIDSTSVLSSFFQ